MDHHICIHGHFYQPPRENAWLEAIEIQDSAYPFHDWNERITAECYAPNSAARILAPDRTIIDLINNYAKISFNFGPTLLSWMEKKEPEAYQAILEADKKSRENFSGHGSAIAQVYNHMIMPLANKKDKQTQVIWGIEDFRHRFKRMPEGMWLSETAVDLDTLEILAEAGIIFTILSPFQAGRVRKIGEDKWRDVSGGKIDPKMPYLCNLPSGEKITLFFYDGPISQEIGFGDILTSGERFANRLLNAFAENGNSSQLVHIATDGETYGHHRQHGDMALAYCLYHIEKNELANLTIYGEYLENNPPQHQVEIIENSSWSCVHGIERWRDDCGCHSGMHGGWNQQWRKPLREALDWLRDKLIPHYEQEMTGLISDPWKFRDNYIKIILDRSEQNINRLIDEYSTRELSREDRVKVLYLLELQRHTMLMYTSCGWFFDEVSGIETTQVLQYAARAIQLAHDDQESDLESEFIRRLEKAPSNLSELKHGGNIYERFIQPAKLNLLRVGTHYAVSSLFESYPESIQIYCYDTQSEVYNLLEAGKLKLGTGSARIRSQITWNDSVVSFAVFYLGGHILNGGVREYMGKESFQTMQQEIENAFLVSDVPEIFRLMDKHFETHNYTLWHLFRDERRKVFDQILEKTLKDIEFQFRRIYETEYSLLQAMNNMQIPLPNALKTPMEFTLNNDIRMILEEDELQLDRLQHIVDELKKMNVSPNKTLLSFVASQRITRLLREFQQDPDNLRTLELLEAVIRTAKSIGLDLDLWEAQNIYFVIGKKYVDKMKKDSERGDEAAENWLKQFVRLGDEMNLRFST